MSEHFSDCCYLSLAIGGMRAGVEATYLNLLERRALALGVRVGVVFRFTFSERYSGCLGDIQLDIKYSDILYREDPDTIYFTNLPCLFPMFLSLLLSFL